MLRWISGLLVVGASWAAEPSDREDHGHEDHGHEDHEHEEEPGVDGDAQEPTGCEELPPKAMQALEAHYEAQQQWEARQQEWAEDWGAAVFQFNAEETRCVSWEDDWLVYAFGGIYSTKAMVERHRWTEGRLVKDGPSAPLLLAEMEKDVPLMRIDTAEGCCGSQWTQSSWYTQEGGMHRVLTLPVAIAPSSSPWPVQTSVVWSGPEWGEEATAEPLQVTVRYVAPTLGGAEIVMNGTLAGPAAVVQWDSQDTEGLTAGLEECLRVRQPFCPLVELQSWLNSQVGQGLTNLTSGAPRALSGLEAEFQLTSVQLVGSGQSQAESTLKTRTRQLLTCYERATRGGLSVSGPLSLSFDVVSGRAQDVSVDLAPDHPTLGSCVAKKIERLRFPGSVAGSVYASWELGPR